MSTMRRERQRYGSTPWLDPDIVVAQNFGLSHARLAVAIRLVQEREDEIRTAWQAHFGR